jgi:hypothetical protein
VGRQNLEVADVFLQHGAAWRRAQLGHLSLGQFKVMSAIEQCRSAALGGHVLHCDACGSDDIAYNSCRNRHCPKCQASAAQRWLKLRQADLLPVEYYHVVFTLPAPISDIANTNKDVIYCILFQTAAETLRTINADPKHLGAHVGVTLVLHTWGSAMTHHPHVHGIVPGGGLSPDGEHWIGCRPGLFLPVRVLSRLFRRRFLERLYEAHDRLHFFGEHEHLSDPETFTEFIRRFLLHVLPRGFHRIRHLKWHFPRQRARPNPHSLARRENLSALIPRFPPSGILRRLLVTACDRCYLVLRGQPSDNPQHKRKFCVL